MDTNDILPLQQSINRFPLNNKDLRINSLLSKAKNIKQTSCLDSKEGKLLGQKTTSTAVQVVNLVIHPALPSN